MRFQVKNTHAARMLAATFAAITVLVPALLAAVLPGRADTLVPVALMLPFVTMGVLDAALSHDERERHS
jgi:hypothetical protein